MALRWEAGEFTKNDWGGTGRRSFVVLYSFKLDAAFHLFVSCPENTLTFCFCVLGIVSKTLRMFPGHSAWTESSSEKCTIHTTVKLSCSPRVSLFLHPSVQSSSIKTQKQCNWFQLPLKPSLHSLLNKLWFKDWQTECQHMFPFSRSRAGSSQSLCYQCRLHCTAMSQGQKFVSCNTFWSACLFKNSPTPLKNCLKDFPKRQKLPLTESLNGVSLWFLWQ